MTHGTPPTLATALLRMFGADSALAGDLAEHYESGKSRWWYWRQVIGIIAASILTEVRRHPVITMRAIALGFAFTWVIWHAYVMWAVLNYDEVLFRTGLLPWFYTHGLAVPRTAIFPATVLLYGLSGGTVLFDNGVSRWIPVWVIGADTSAVDGSDVVRRRGRRDTENFVERVESCFASHGCYLSVDHGLHAGYRPQRWLDIRLYEVRAEGVLKSSRRTRGTSKVLAILSRFR